MPRARHTCTRLRPDVPLGLSPENQNKVSSYVGPTAASVVDAGLSAGDFALRAIAAPIHAGAYGIGQTVNELGLSQGQGDTGPARDILGLLDIAGLMTAPLAGASLPRASVVPRPTGAGCHRGRTSGFVAIQVRRFSPEGRSGRRTTTPNFAGNINLNRIQAPEDVKNVIRETAAQNENFIGARRGKMTL